MLPRTKLSNMESSCIGTDAGAKSVLIHLLSMNRLVDVQIVNSPSSGLSDIWRCFEAHTGLLCLLLHVAPLRLLCLAWERCHLVSISTGQISTNIGHSWAGLPPPAQLRVQAVASRHPVWSADRYRGRHYACVPYLLLSRNNTAWRVLRFKHYLSLLGPAKWVQTFGTLLARRRAWERQTRACSPDTSSILFSGPLAWLLKQTAVSLLFTLFQKHINLL